MAISILHRIEYRAMAALQATLVTALFGFIGWLGATSFFWGFGFAVLGAAIDFARWHYRYDWDLRKFVVNNWRDEDFLIALQQNGTAEPFKRMARAERLFNTALFLPWFCVFVTVLMLNMVFSDTLFCSNAAAIDAFSFPAFHLAGAVRFIFEQLQTGGYECRAVFVKFYYSLVFYMFAISIAAYAIYYSHNCNIHNSAKELFVDGVLDIGRMAGVIRRPVGALLLVFALIFLLFWLRDVEFEKRGGLLWNIHESNFQLFMLAALMCSLLVIIRMVFYTSRYSTIKRYLR
ncbi:MAG: hypothetical protein Q7V31_09095 [Parvibaculum sp.]|uniref:hypothetical protein n=1 Tax=Parvibaculum sp. TaxID=2024848 RepID=UPI0027233211|nr:hypothetical protein [Parvibaculum sp.]MDO8839075.1 hypothetical protein [Parvibaculum sp.]